MVKITKEVINQILEEDRDKELGIIEKEEVSEKFIPSFFDKINLAEQFIKLIPLYYDESGLWWIWREENLRWDMIDDVDILNHIRFSSTANVISSKERTEIIMALKQVARTKKPIEMNKNWIQFDKIIIDIKTGDKFKASSQYFMTNPIPHKLGLSEDTPIMNELFESWVGKNNIQKLYEIIAYCCLSDYPLERIFCLLGGGSNGKSCFLSLLSRFLGFNNICSTDLNLLVKSRFESAKLRDKLACLMGETDFNDLTSTQLLKRLVSGKDTIGIEYKNKGLYNYINHAKLIIATNNLPSTSDKTIGFYRRWMIIDFPNEFTEKEDVLSKIPIEEYNNLALKCVGIVGNLISKREFTNEGNYEDRKKRYESKSNFLEEFLKTTTIEDEESYITKRDFYKNFNDWSKDNHHRELSERMVGLCMKKLNVSSNLIRLDWIKDGKKVVARVWMGLKWK